MLFISLPETNSKIILLALQTAQFKLSFEMSIPMKKIKLSIILNEFNLYLSQHAVSHSIRHGAPRGIYNAIVLKQLVAASFPVWLESSLQIKQAGGLQRGKSDQIDAQRIAEYAFRFRDCIRIWQPPRQLLKDLTHLSALRQRLLLVRSQSHRRPGSTAY